MRITKLQIHNFLGLAFVKLTKIGKIVRVTGENRVGKSSLLHAIKESLKSSGVKPTLIKTGEDKSEIMVELDDRIAIHRTITETTNQVKVSVDGAPQKNPVAFLESLLGGLGLNPIEFFLAKPPRQRAIILKALPVKLSRKMLEDVVAESKVSIDLSRIDYDDHGLTILSGLQKHVYDLRHLTNQDVTRLKKSIEQDTADLPEGVDPKRWDGFNLDAAMANLEDAQRITSENLAKQDERSMLREGYASMTAEIERLNGKLQKNTERGIELTAEIDAFEAPDVDAIKQEVLDHREHLSYAATLEAIERKRTDLTVRETEHRSLDWLHDKLNDDLPQRLIEKADIPIAGLKVTPDGIMVGETPLDQLSEAEQIIFSTTLARALCGQAKFVCVDGFEAIVGKLRKKFEAEMEQDDIEYFIAEATPDEKLGVDGGTLSTEQEAS